MVTTGIEYINNLPARLLADSNSALSWPTNSVLSATPEMHLFVAALILHAVLITQCSGKPTPPPLSRDNQSYEAPLGSKKLTEHAKKLQEKADRGPESIEAGAVEVREYN